MSRRIKKIIGNLLTFVMVLAMAIPSTTATANANGIVKGSDEVDVETSYSTVLKTGEKASISIKNTVLTVKIDGKESVFKTGNITKTTDVAVITESDGLIHILTLAGVYYVYDCYTGVQMVAYRNSVNGKYCSSRNSHAYMVYGKSLINNMYFYEWITSNSVSRERLMTRIEFDLIIEGIDPSEDEDPTTKATEAPTERPTERPTEEPTQAPTQAPTERPTEEPTTAKKTSKSSLKVNKTTVILVSGKSYQISYSAKDKNGKAVKATLTGGAGCFSTSVLSTSRIKITAKSVSKTTYGTFTVNNGSLRTVVTVIVNPKKIVDKSSLTVAKDIVVVKPGSCVTINYKATNKTGTRVKASKVYSGSNHVTVSYNSKSIKIKTAKSTKDSVFTTVTVRSGSYTKKIFVVTEPVPYVTTNATTSVVKINRYNQYGEYQARIYFNKKDKVVRYKDIEMKNAVATGFIKKSSNVAILTADGNLYSVPKSQGNIILIGTNVKNIRADRSGFIVTAVYNTNKSISIVGL